MCFYRLPMESAQPQPWWDGPWLVLGLICASAAPLLWPAIPPLIDLPGHMARYQIALELQRSPFLHQWYDFQWALVGNLGVDLLVLPLAPVFGLELAVKLIVIAIPMLSVAGMLLVAREIHGRIPVTAFFALPLAYAYPFQFGFVNFTLGLALAFCALGLWLRLARLGPWRFRWLMFIPLSAILFIVHCVAWAMLVVTIFMIEALDARDRAWRDSIGCAIRSCLPLLAPLPLLLLWLDRGAAGVTVYFPWQAKAGQLQQVLHDRSMLFDVLSASLLYGVLALAVGRIGFRLDRRLAGAAGVLFVVYLVTPGILKEVAFADARMLPFLLALAILAITPTMANGRSHRLVALAGLLFFAARLGGDIVGYAQLDRQHRAQLEALAHVPRGARILVKAAEGCGWDTPRVGHLGSMAIVRREAFVNGQWPMRGGKLLSVKYAAAGPFQYSPSQLLHPAACRDGQEYDMPQTLRLMPRSAFDYLWLINVPRKEWPRDPGLVPIWHGPTGILYQLRK